MNDTGYTIAVESAVLGGSCCLATRTQIVDERRGSGGISRAEDLLIDIDELLKKNSVLPEQITNFVVSAGPGSFTGIRIGIATALGFCAGLNTVPLQISLLDAMASICDGEGITMVAVPAGRGMAHELIAEITANSISYLSQPSAVALDQMSELARAAGASRITAFVGHFDESLFATFDKDVLLLPRSPAAALVSAAADRRVTETRDPILVSKTHTS